jgi:hypothetical protein
LLAEEHRALGFTTPPPIRRHGFRVWVCNTDAVETFLDAATQWRLVSSATGGTRVIGLDYLGARAGWELAGVEVTPALFAKIQLIEQGAIAAFNAK